MRSASCAGLAATVTSRRQRAGRGAPQRPGVRPDGTARRGGEPADPKDPKNRRLYAQYLIDTGKATAAVDVLRPLAQRLSKDHPEFAEATGLLGRAYKQVFFDADDKTSPGARDALKQAIVAYRKPFEKNRANTWHGVNLVALLTRARRLGLVAPDLQPREVAKEVVAALEATPEDQRDEWFLPTLAEASLGLDDWDAVERNVKAYAAAGDAKAFQIASTLRQFTEVWDLEATDDRGRGLVATLRARLSSCRAVDSRWPPRSSSACVPSRLLTRPARGGARHGGSADLQMVEDRPRPGAGGCGDLPAARRPGRHGLSGSRCGSRPRAGRELLVLTNFHVVNEHGASPGIKPEDAEVVFEAVTRTGVFGRPDRVELADRAPRRDPAATADPGHRHPAPADGEDLPVLEETARVYSSAIPVAVISPSRSRTTSCSTTRGRPPASRRSRALPGPLPGPDRGRQLRQPGVQREALGGDRAAPQGRQDRHAEAQWPAGRIRRQRGDRNPVDQGAIVQE